MNWPEQIHELAKKKGISLRKLALSLDIGHVYLCDVARGSKPASPLLRYRVLKELGVKLDREALLQLLPDELAAEIREDANW